MTAATPTTRPALTGLCRALLVVVGDTSLTRVLIWVQTPILPSTPYTIATATTQTASMTTDTTKLSFMTVHGSMCLITKRALRGPRRAVATCTGRGRTAEASPPTAAATGTALPVTATPPSRAAAGSVGHPVATLRGPDVVVLNSGAGSGGATGDSSGSDSIRAAWDSVGESTGGRAYGLRAGRPPRSPSVTALPIANRSDRRRARHPRW